MIAPISAAEQRHPSTDHLNLEFGRDVRSAAMVWLALQEAADSYRQVYGHVPDELDDLINQQMHRTLCSITGHAYRHDRREGGQR